MQTIIKSLFNIINFIIAILMAMLVVIVFLNVVLRYGFNSGISVTVEISQYLFIWVIFLGAIVAMERGEHIAADVLKNYLSPMLKNVFIIIGNIVIFCCSLLILKGCWERMILDMANTSPISEIPIGVFFMAGVAAGTGMSAISFSRIIRATMNSVYKTQ